MDKIKWHSCNLVLNCQVTNCTLPTEWLLCSDAEKLAICSTLIEKEFLIMVSSTAGKQLFYKQNLAFNCNGQELGIIWWNPKEIELNHYIYRVQVFIYSKWIQENCLRLIGSYQILNGQTNAQTMDRWNTSTILLMTGNNKYSLAWNSCVHFVKLCCNC